MNFLAHIFLSGESQEIQVGNFLGDWVKGRNYKSYSPGIQKGILLHRAIDAYTDKHPVTYKWAQELKSHYHKYAGVVVDILYDHFLSIRWNDFTQTSLTGFIDQAYSNLKANYSNLPESAQYAVCQMVLNKTLESYIQINGMYETLRLMSIYTSMPPYPEFGVHVMKQHYDEFIKDFRHFMQDIIHFVMREYHVYPVKISEIKRIAS